jgi:tetratricopeptide (TPR) repeat protein
MVLKNQKLKQLSLIILLPCLFLFTSTSILAQEEEEVEFTQGQQSETTETIQGDPVEIFYQAQDAHSRGELKKALELYDKALKINPEFPEAEYQRATIYLTLGETENAEKSFRRAIEIRRDWTLPIAELGALLVQKSEYPEAEKLLNKAIRLDGMSFPAYVALTELKIKTNASEEEFKILLAKLQYLTTKSKIPAAVWASRGAIERQLKDLTEAKKSIKRALFIDEKNTFAREESIEISILDGDYQGAIKNAENLLQINPLSISAKLLLARALHLDGKSQAAIAILESIEKPSDEVNKIKTSISLSGNDDIKALEELLAKDEKNVSVLGRLCVLSRTTQPEKALEYCRNASQIEPGEINHAIGYGAALVQLKRYPSAVTLFQSLLGSSPENYTIKANLATALFQMKRYEEAIVEYRWIISKQPKLAIAYYFLAISHDELENYLDAMANYQQFLKLADDSFQLEIEKVRLRMPTLQKQINQGKGKKRS